VTSPHVAKDNLYVRETVSKAQLQGADKKVIQGPVTSLRQSARDLAEKESVDSNPASDGNMVLVVSGDGTVSDVLHGATSQPHASGGDAPGFSLDDLGIEGLAECVRRNARRALKSRRTHCEELQSDNGTYELIFVAQGRDRVLLVLRNVSEQKMAISRVRHLAYVDEPTGLPNREFLLAELGRVTDELRLREGRAAVICFDIDKLDLPGYAVGSHIQDAALKVLATRLTNGLRSVNYMTGDGAARYCVAARIDFRRLAVMLPGIETGSEAEAVAQRLAELLQRPIKIENKSISVTAHAGIALFPQDGIDAITLFENSLSAMEDAKSTQLGPHKFHSGTAQVQALQRQDLELELKTALHRDELEMHYLPIVCAETREIASIEALLRWPQTAIGHQSIRRVVALAEHTGLILPIGEWVFRQSCEQLKAWHEAGFSGLRMAVNLSVQEFSRPDIAAKIEEILESCSVSPYDLDCEITEHMLFRDAMKDYATCRQLKRLGVGIVVDDYGTGVCSLGHLAHSPVDAIKIDNSFVANCDREGQDRAACAAATAMAHELGMRIVAEGVETMLQAEILHAQGCDYLQGYLFCKPSPADDVQAYLAENSVTQGEVSGILSVLRRP
jgi:diguanylate cyclase (GGDEF)-like protein